MLFYLGTSTLVLLVAQPTTPSSRNSLSGSLYARSDPARYVSGRFECLMSLIAGVRRGKAEERAAVLK